MAKLERTTSQSIETFPVYSIGLSKTMLLKICVLKIAEGSETWERSVVRASLFVVIFVYLTLSCCVWFSSFLHERKGVLNTAFPLLPQINVKKKYLGLK